MGVSIVAGVVLLQACNQLIAGHERTRVLTYIVYLGLELTALMIALSATQAWSFKRRLRSLPSILLGVLVAGTIGVVSGLCLWVVSQHYPGVRLHTGPPPSPIQAALFGFSYAQFHFGLWTLAFVYPFAAEDARVRALEAEQLRSAAELSRLRAHLEPHFLLNTLNAIAGLVTEDPREARRLLGCLGDLLRDAVRDEPEMQTVEEEVGWLKRYAAILEARHRGAISFTWDIAPEARRVRLPRLLLQPIVENAVKHGALRRRGGGGTVALRARVEGARAIFVIEDNGPGLAEPPRPGSFGLPGVRRRLELKYVQAALKLEATEAGTRATIDVPACEGEPSDHALAGAAPEPEGKPKTESKPGVVEEAVEAAS